MLNKIVQFKCSTIFSSMGEAEFFYLDFIPADFSFSVNIRKALKS